MSFSLADGQAKVRINLGGIKLIGFRIVENALLILFLLLVGGAQIQVCLIELTIDLDSFVEIEHGFIRLLLFVVVYS